MTIAREQTTPPAGEVREGWLEIDVRWLAGLFYAEATGEAKVIPGVPMKIHVGIRSPAVPTKGAIMDGRLQQAFVPLGLAPKTPRES